MGIKKKSLKLKKRRGTDYAIIIPAKDESKVIKGLLDSIKKQVSDLSSTYIIVESKEDKTCKIASEYGANIILRKNLDLKRKGYALDEGIKEILKSKKYDLYFIFDADNILDENFINEMLITYKQGYDIAVGYRNIKNSSNVVAACSGLTFSMINTLSNKYKIKKNKQITISGTGYYISGDLINKWQGFPFHSLTEDYELTLYTTANNIPTYYNEKAIYYDEQPTSLKVSIKQRTRWVKGFLEARKLRIKDIKNDFSKVIGIIPYLLIVIGAFLLAITNILSTLYYIATSNYNYVETIFNTITIILLVYTSLIVFTTLLIILENDKLNLSNQLKIKAIFFNPIFLATYVNCLIKAITKKDISWDKIEHKENKIINEKSQY